MKCSKSIMKIMIRNISLLLFVFLQLLALLAHARTLSAESSWDESSNLKMRTSADHHHHQPPSPAAEKKMIITSDSTTDPVGKKSANNNNNNISWRKFKTIVADYQKKAKSPPPSPGSPSGGNQSPRTSSPPAHSLCNIRINGPCDQDQNIVIVGSGYTKL